ncbi:hypothetical protein B0T18DRAFT_387249 [Schizothecium vesticola]|uniref:Uncharacterized protein n=1 Tax=Schizothecium vesticola TaxID=314040 RepID=A0AA40F4W6_9PEZI|nr:hypothetical protein B0T18DRAFT_387249 [Schizothecium vesticola]
MFSKSATLFLVGLAIIAGPAAAAPGSTGQMLEARDTWLSDFDMKEACKQQYGSTGDNWAAEVIGNRCGDWRCRRLGQEKELNMDAYCVRRWQNSNVYALCKDGVYSWACWSR